MNKSKTRLPEWDFVKAVLIIFVVWGHVCSYISDSSYENNALTSVIRLYQMPMFILVSGYFQKACCTFLDIKEKVIKILKFLCIPYLCWSGIGCVIVIGVSAVTDTEVLCGGGYNLIKLFGQQANILWYLGCLILCESVYAVVSYLVKKFGLLWLYLSLVLSIVIPVDIWHFCFLWPFFLLGVVIRRTGFVTGIIQFFKRWHCCIGIIIWTVLFIIAQLYKTEYTFYNAPNYLLASGVSAIWRQLLLVLFRYIIYGTVTVSFLCFFFIVYENIKNKRICKIFLELGRNTLGIFIIHILFLYHMFRPIVKNVTEGMGILPDLPAIRYYLVGTVISAFTIVISYIITRIIRRNSILNKILFGRKKLQ